ncbi:uncharacterized protein LOC122250699 isoform X2 [Penaeus japonicus]|uniref:uncharacterized protein LOC122250699 isoform X2 n=1 Tax=Penaeus japonicus TaxID=27405 RepID=UPI001C710E1D|nr:uncharacterized protein LOC122250699 isoform X2 [Penaeus japonicus]
MDLSTALRDARYSNSISRKMLRVLYFLPSPLFHAIDKCRREIPKIFASERYKILIFSSLLFLTILLLSIPVIPERILGIRSPELTLENYYHDLNSSSIAPTLLGNNVTNDPHKIHKRHIPHKFWARVRPHNRFNKKKRRSLQEKPEAVVEGQQERNPPPKLDKRMTV